MKQLIKSLWAAFIFAASLSILTHAEYSNPWVRWATQFKPGSDEIIIPKYTNNSTCETSTWANLGWTPCIIYSGSQTWLTWDRQVSYQSGSAVYAHKVHYIKSTHIKRERYTTLNHAVELVATCKSGTEDFNQFRYIKRVNRQYYSAWFIPSGWKAGSTPSAYKVVCKYIIVRP